MFVEPVKKTLRGSDFSRINWQKEFKVTPDQFFTITVHKADEQTGVENQIPPYDLPKKYPENIRQLVKEAIADGEREKKEGFNREESFDNLFKIQEKINEYTSQKNEKRA